RGAAAQDRGHRYRSPDTARGAHAAGGVEEGGRGVTRCVLAIALAASLGACVRRPIANPNVIVLGITSGPNNLDPRVATDDTSQKLDQLIFSSLMALDEHLRAVPQLAERVENPDPTTWVITIRRGVKFHDGHELTSADVVYTFRSLLAPGFVSPLKGAYRMVRSVDAPDRYTVVF